MGYVNSEYAEPGTKLKVQVWNGGVWRARARS
jgi:hypothetical protein